MELKKVLKPGVMGSIPTGDEPLTTIRKNYPNSIKYHNSYKMVKLAPSSTTGVRDSATKKIEVKLTHFY